MEDSLGLKEGDTYYMYAEKHIEVKRARGIATASLLAPSTALRFPATTRGTPPVMAGL
jgi:hypothetical protein